MTDDEDNDVDGKKAPRKELKRLIYEARKSRKKEKGHFQLVDNRGYCVKYLKITPKTVTQLPEISPPENRPKRQKKTTREQLDTITDCIEEIKEHALKEDELRLMRLLNYNGTKFSDIKRAKEIEKAGLPIPPKLNDFIGKKLIRMKKRRERISSLPVKLIISNQKVENKPIQKPIILAPIQSVKLPIKQVNYQSVIVKRDSKVEANRVKLPSVLMESEIIDSILNNHVTIITGDTGCGKSTQIPQFLYENGFCHEGTIIGVTQPRRVACTAVSNQVKLEIGDESLVGFHIRNLKSNAKNCKIKFMTEGILLQEIRNDLLCSKYSVIIIDEAHERSLNCDILIGILSRVIVSRWKRFESQGTLPLKLVIMSATINVEQFIKSDIFNNLTINHIHISTLNQSPVSIHYLKKTNENYLEEAKKAVIKIHTKFPRGSILVFVCGKDEIKSLSRSLAEHNLDHSPDDDDSPDNSVIDDDVELSNRWKGSDGSGSLKIVPLHASQASHEQNIAFSDPKDSERVVIISTNVAETSITLPNIRYVVDCGKEKRKSYTCGSTISKFVIGDISQSSANQRAGRAGRLGPGHCYRMYSSSVYDHIFKPYSQPEIDVCPLDGTLLFLCSLGIVHLDTFPFLTSPTIENINRALKTLVDLDALIIDGDKVIITMLGKAMSEIPIEPRYSRMILIAMSKQINNLVWYTCLIASSLSLGLLIDNPKIMDFDNDIQMYLELCIQFSKIELTNRYTWCVESGINYKSIVAIIDLAKLLLEVCNTRFDNRDGKPFEPCNEKPNSEQLNLLYEIVLSGLIDHIALLESEADKLYTTLMDGIEAKIHGHCKCKNKHKLITYNGISENNGHYLTGVLPIDKEMIARVDSILVETVGEPQAIPPALYIPELDSVIGYVNRIYKPTHLNLGVIRYPIKGDIASKCFGKALVNGKVYQHINNPNIYEDVVKYLINLNCYNRCHLEEILKVCKGIDANKLKDLLNFNNN